MNFREPFTVNKSEDVGNLFALFNREGQQRYREIVKNDQTLEARKRWPVFSEVPLGKANELPQSRETRASSRAEPATLTRTPGLLRAQTSRPTETVHKAAPQQEAMARMPASTAPHAETRLQNLFQRLENGAAATRPMREIPVETPRILNRPSPVSTLFNRYR